METQATLRLIPSARNAAILREVRDVLARTLHSDESPPSDPEPAPRRSLRAWPGSWIGTTALDAAAALLAWSILPTADTRGLVTALAGALVLAEAARLHAARLAWSALRDVPALVAVAAVTGALVGLVGGEVSTRLLDGLAFGAGFLAIEVAVRSAAYAAVRAARRTRRFARPVVVVGVGAEARQLAMTVLSRHEYGLRPVGFIDAGDAPSPRDAALPVLGGIARLPEVVGRLGVGAVIFAFEEQPSPAVLRALRRALARGLAVWVVPRQFDPPGWCTSGVVEWIWGVPLVRLRPAPRARDLAELA